MHLLKPPSGLPRDIEPTSLSLHQTNGWTQALFIIYIVITPFYCICSAGAFFLMKHRGGMEYRSTCIIVYLSPVSHGLLLLSLLSLNEDWQGYIYSSWQIVQCVIGLALVASLWEWLEEETQLGGWLLNFGCLIVATLLFNARRPYEALPWADLGSPLSQPVSWMLILSNAVYMCKHLYRNWKERAQ